MKFTGLTCFKCGKSFEPAILGSHDNLLHGVIFRSGGGFGSDYDPVHDGYLCIAVCDGCLWEEGYAGNVIEAMPVHNPAPPPGLGKWNPDSSQGC